MSTPGVTHRGSPQREVAAASPEPDGTGAVCHEALLYRDLGELVRGAVAFLEPALAAGDPVMVAVPAERGAALREALGARAARVTFVDMLRLGRNPGRIISAWSDFALLAADAGRTPWGVGEPVWAGRTPEEVEECVLHEHLLNHAFAHGPSLRLLCPYDAAALPARALEDAERSHPAVRERGARRPSAGYLGPGEMPILAGDLPPAEHAERLEFGVGDLACTRRLVERHAARAGLGPRRRGDLALAVSEIATNSVLHGGGRGTLAVWRQGDAVVCEVRDRGRFRDPLVGRMRPRGLRRDGRGLWLANQVCDLVRIRSHKGGSVVRVHVGPG